MINQFVIWKDLRVFFGQNPKTISRHSHPIIQLVLAFRGTFFHKENSGNWIEKKGLLIAPNYTHECNAKNIPIISIEIDPQSNLGEWIRNNQLRNRSILDYPSSSINSIDPDRLSACIGNGDWTALRTIIENIFFFRQKDQAFQKDQRVQDVLDFIYKHINQHITTKKLMEVSHLSESRLMHLFKEEMGLPIRNYILWSRLQIVFESILAGRSLTEASYEAGFSDQAHMTRTFIKMIGITPSAVTKNSKFVQVSFPE